MTNREVRAEIIKKENGGTQSRVVAYSAPLPPASEFEKYELVLPGAADRIIKLAENQNKHRTFIEKFVVVFDSIKSLGGLIGAIVIVVAGIYGGIYLIMNNKSTEGLVSILSPLALIVSAFVYQQSRKKDDEKG